MTVLQPQAISKFRFKFASVAPHHAVMAAKAAFTTPQLIGSITDSSGILDRPPNKSTRDRIMIAKPGPERQQHGLRRLGEVSHGKQRMRRTSWPHRLRG
jgi:hypothetical protein